MLTIRKSGNKNFQHYFDDFVYSASDIIAIFEGDFMKVRSHSGRIIGEKDGYLFNNVTIYDDTVSGGAETFTSIILLEQRLIDLGYIAFYNDGNNDTTWGNIGGVLADQTDLIDYINTRTIDGGGA